MIYIYPVGGLGNMFFHIASIYTLAKDNGDDICLLNIDEKIKELDAATNITDTWSDTKHSVKYRYFLDRFPQKVGDVPQKITHPFQYVPITYRPETRYFGYFQTEKYFKHRRNEILELFKPDDSFQEKINEYSDLFNSISLHVRRSWVNLKLNHIHLVHTMDYYERALALLPKELRVLVFSDDLEWCKENFIGDRFIFIDEIDYISIYLMGKMDYHIISSSTFSWWGAWLSDSKKVISPVRLYGTGRNIPEGDVIPENWIKI